jgi:hypothetical protein
MKSTLFIVYYLSQLPVSTKSSIKNIDDNAPIPSLSNNNTFILTEYSKEKIWL